MRAALRGGPWSVSHSNNQATPVECQRQRALFPIFTPLTFDTICRLVTTSYHCRSVAPNELRYRIIQFFAAIFNGLDFPRRPQPDVGRRSIMYRRSGLRAASMATFLYDGAPRELLPAATSNRKANCCKNDTL